MTTHYRVFSVFLHSHAAIIAVIALSACTPMPTEIYYQGQVSSITNELQPDGQPKPNVTFPSLSNFLQEDLKNLQARVEEKGIVLTLDDLHFDPNSADIKAEETHKLTQIINFLEKHNYFQVIIEGHTDSLGSDDHNIELSRARAISVYRRLLSAGISQERLAVIALGDKFPIAPNDSEEGRKTNRRVEVVISGNKGVRSDQ